MTSEAVPVHTRFSVLGRGSSALVFTPAIHCDASLGSDAEVSKLSQLSESDSNADVVRHLRHADPHGWFFVFNMETCDPPPLPVDAPTLADTKTFYVQTRARGTTLAELTHRRLGHDDSESALQLCWKIAASLSLAVYVLHHVAHISHRDLSSNNIMVFTSDKDDELQGQCKLIDFDHAQVVAKERRMFPEDADLLQILEENLEIAVGAMLPDDPETWSASCFFIAYCTLLENGLNFPGPVELQTFARDAAQTLLASHDYIAHIYSEHFEK